MVSTINNNPLKFTLPQALQCAQPTELRGIHRDEVRLMVSHRATDQVEHSQFKYLDQLLQAGDVLVVNTSATLPAALPISLPNGLPGRLHLSTRRSEKEWLVEVRCVAENKTHRYTDLNAGQTFVLPEGGIVSLQAPYYEGIPNLEHLQLWVARFELPIPVVDFLQKHGTPIRYAQVAEAYPIDYYQTVFAKHPGSAEMPSAGRAFTPQLVSRLIAKGVQFAPILLHTGVASLETNERPYPEYYEVSQTTASLINWAKAEGRRIISVGTTAVRALETVTDEDGYLKAGEGWTNVFITPERGLRAVDGLLTGFHEPKASHLLMLEALAERSHLAMAYEAAIKGGYQWHEFGDLHLVL